MTGPAPSRFPSSANPWSLSVLWWRVPGWAAIVAATVTQSGGTASGVVTGVLMTASVLTLQFVRAEPPALRRSAVLATTVLALAACVVTPNGFAYVLVFVAAARAPHSFAGRVLQGFTVLDTVAVAVTVAVVSHSLLGLLAGLGVPFLVQRTVEHAELVRERDRATALLAEVQRGRESEARAAALQERGRIAREMHDVLAHTLAGLSVQLQAVRAVAAREQVGPAVLEPLDRAATLARDGLGEARSAVSTLRDPAPLGLDALPALVERHPGDTRLTVDGTPGSVADGTGHAVYRAVQESLTNATRYAPGSPVLVHLAWQAERLAVTVTDTGCGPDREPVTGVGSGLGLAGMDERIDSVGGTLQAGRADRGWQVRIEVPTRPASAAAGAPR